MRISHNTLIELGSTIYPIKQSKSDANVAATLASYDVLSKTERHPDLQPIILWHQRTDNYTVGLTIRGRSGENV